MKAALERGKRNFEEIFWVICTLHVFKNYKKCIWNILKLMVVAQFLCTQHCTGTKLCGSWLYKHCMSYSEMLWKPPSPLSDRQDFLLLDDLINPLGAYRLTYFILKVHHPFSFPHLIIVLCICWYTNNVLDFNICDSKNCFFSFFSFYLVLYPAEHLGHD